MKDKKNYEKIIRDNEKLIKEDYEKAIHEAKKQMIKINKAKTEIGEEKIKIIQGGTEVTIECKPGTIRISIPPKDTIYLNTFLPPRFSIDGEMKSITLTKKIKRKK